jgi:pro-kumamolisin-like protein/Big-like domain-containing protein
MSNVRSLRPTLLVALFCLMLAALSQPVFATVHTTAHPEARIAGGIDNSQRTVIHGHVPRVIGSSTDLGRLPADTPMRHMMLVLKPTFEQDNELRKVINQQQDKRTANYHQWATPEEFGEKFGAHDSDIAQIKNWLASQGFSVELVGKNKRIIQFSGVSGQVETAFRTEMHYYKTPNGETHISANADISVPTALRPVIEGLHGTHNFFKKPHMVNPTTLKSRMKPSTHKWTFGSLASDNTLVGPNDFATIYNTEPLLNAGINGTGVRIGIIAQSDILMSDVQTYRQMFNLPLNNPNFVIPGEDPGVSPGDDSESDLDVEISGGIAPGATVDFVPGASTLTIAGVDLSLMYMVENNTDDIISSSYGGCEAEDTAAQINFYLTMSEQGAAQGQTLMVASGDTGPSECDDSSDNAETLGYAVGDNDGNAYVLSIGGTQFNEGGQQGTSSTATFTGTPTFWSPNNNNGLNSALSYIPEIPWNEAAGSGSVGQEELWSGNGGVGADFATPAFQTNGSGAIPGLPMPGQGDPFIGDKVSSVTIPGTWTVVPTSVTLSGGGCTTQYGCAFNNATGTVALKSGAVTFTSTNPGQGYVSAPTVVVTGGTCSTGCTTATATIASVTDPATPNVVGPHRYQPDLAFNAAAEHDPTAYCSEGVCQVDSNGNVLDVGLVGGTSVAAPSYAGVQALVNQYNGGRQGMPGYILYALAAQQATTPGWANCAAKYSPVTLPASNCVFNDMVQGNTNICSVAGSGGAPTTCKTTAAVIGWPATTGYDYASGLGSVNVYNLAKQWGSVTFNSSSTSMSLTASGITHGQAVPVTVNVTGGAGTPTGDVAFIASSGSLGDPINPTSNTFTEEVALQGQSAFGTLNSGTYSGSINNLPGGSYNVYARYAGDPTFGSSTSALIPVSVNPETSTTTLGTSSISGSTISPTTTFTYGQVVWVDAIPRGASNVGVPTGTVTVSDNGNAIATLALNSTGQAFLVAGSISSSSDLDLVVYQNINGFTGGSHSLTASYSGDSSFNPNTAGPFNFTVNPLSVTPTLASGATQITAGSAVQLTASFASSLSAGGNSVNNRTPGLSGPTGTVTFTDTTTSAVLGTAPVVSTATFTATAVLSTTAITTTGANSITASYSGDSNYAATTSTAVSVTVGTATATSTAVTSSGNPTTLGGRPTFTATISGGSTTPTSGTVTFYDGTTVLGTGTVGSAHTATLKVASSPAFVGGAHNITAAFGGVATTAAASTSPVFVENVTLGTTTTQLTNLTAAGAGKTVTFSAVVTPSSTSATYAPSAGVQFFDGATAIGSPVPLYFISSNNDGYALYEAQYSTSSLSQGTHSITAQYAGDVNYSASTSNAQTLNIGGTSKGIYSPASGSAFSGTSATFLWYAAGTAYWLDVGAEQGGHEYYSSGAISSATLSATVNSLPTNGSTVWVRWYYYQQAGGWQSIDYNYTAVGGNSNKGVITNPVPSTTLTGSIVTFNWTAGSGATAYWIDIGSTAGAHDIYSSGNVGNVLTTTVSGLPTTGSTVYVTLYSLVSGTWISNAYTYTAYSLASAAGVMTTPTPGSMLTGSSVTFDWTAGSGASAYWIDVGSTAGGHDIYSSGSLGNVLTTTVNGLPTDGSMVYVTLYSQIGGTWSGNAYTYTALNATSGIAVMQSPANNSVLSGNAVTFTWSSDANATGYWVDVSTVGPGGNDLDSSGNLGTALTETIYNLPATNPGTTVYVTLYSYVGGQWLNNAYTYVSGP